MMEALVSGSGKLLAEKRRKKKERESAVAQQRELELHRQEQMRLKTQEHTRQPPDRRGCEPHQHMTGSVQSKAYSARKCTSFQVSLRSCPTCACQAVKPGAERVWPAAQARKVILKNPEATAQRPIQNAGLEILQRTRLHQRARSEAGMIMTQKSSRKWNACGHGR